MTDEVVRDQRWANVWAHTKPIHKLDRGLRDARYVGHSPHAVEVLVEVIYLGELVTTRMIITPEEFGGFGYDDGLLGWYMIRAIRRVDEALKQVNPKIHSERRVKYCRPWNDVVLTSHKDALVTCPQCIHFLGQKISKGTI